MTRLLLLTASLALAGCAGSMPPSLGHRLEGARAPRLAELSSAPRGGVGLPGAAPTRVTVVDFWASWCPGCQQSMPALDELYRDKRGEGLAVVGVSVDERGVDATAAAEQLHASFPIVLDPLMRFAASYGVGQVPLTFVIDGRGTVRWVGSDPAQIRRAVEVLLAE